ncbi:Protein Y41D4A.6 [Aphelenchoides avenae]|nr:Protein Y41D4A.6 [Aphelenchus avenae]
MTAVKAGLTVSDNIAKAIDTARKLRPLNALITETFTLAEEHAKNAIENGFQPFSVVVKDSFALEGYPLTCASAMLEKYVSPYTATIVQRLIDHGGCVIGKANMDEYSMGSTSTRGLFGPVKQSVGMSALAHSKDFRIAGGSSGGSAVAVASGFADVAIGTDTGGSTRNPAAFNGVFGFKPSYD